MQKLLALDLSVTSTGWCIFKSLKTKNKDYGILSCGRIITKVEDYKCEDDRLNYICNEIEKLINQNQISIVLMEEQYVGVNKSIGLLLRKLLGASMRTANNNKCRTEYLQSTTVRKYLNITPRTKITFDKNGKEKTANIKVNKEDVALYIINNIIDVGEYNDGSGKKKTSDIYDAIALGVAYINILRKEDQHGVKSKKTKSRSKTS